MTATLRIFAGLIVLCLLVPAVPLASAGSRGAPRPRIVFKPIPFPGARKLEMRAYAKRHYGIDAWRLL